MFILFTNYSCNNLSSLLSQNLFLKYAVIIPLFLLTFHLFKKENKAHQTNFSIHSYNFRNLFRLLKFEPETC